MLWPIVNLEASLEEVSPSENMGLPAQTSVSWGQGKLWTWGRMEALDWLILTSFTTIYSPQALAGGIPTGG